MEVFLRLYIADEGGEKKTLFDSDVQNDWMSEIRSAFEKSTEGINFSDFSEDFQDFTNREIAQAVGREFHQEIRRCMGSSQQENDLTGKGFKLEMNNQHGNLTLKSPTGTPIMKIKSLNLTQDYFRILRKFILSVSAGSDEAIGLGIFLEHLLEQISLPHSLAESFYLPAARTGIMQSSRAIAGALIQRATQARLQTVSVPTLSGILSDFLQHITFMDTTGSPDPNTKKIADDMESNILHGSIESQGSERNLYPQFIYTHNGLEIPLLRSSSMVTELAPVVLFLRHRIKQGDLLIIEEPEAHLHPAAQRGMAKAVVDLIRVGVRVVVTTHSEYFLEQISNYVHSSQLTPAERNALTGHTDTYLRVDEIGAYAFNQHAKGTIVKRLKFDQESGLFPEDHNEVSSALYNETADILNKIEEKE